jgi:hypothetical protein
MDWEDVLPHALRRCGEVSHRVCQEAAAGHITGPVAREQFVGSLAEGHIMAARGCAAGQAAYAGQAYGLGSAMLWPAFSAVLV